MSKRFIDTNIWDQNKWFRKLDIKYKLIWFYLISRCDPVGVWEEDIELASFIIGIDYKLEEVIKKFDGKIKIINGGKKWWIVDFCNFQYGELKEDSENNRPHQSFISQLKKHSLWIDYKRLSYSLKDKEKDKDKDKDKEEDEKYKPDFEEIWLKYPSKIKRKESERHFITTVKTEKDFDDINQALDNYKNHLAANDWKKPQNGSTWFNNWRDWIDWIEPQKLYTYSEVLEMNFKAGIRGDLGYHKIEGNGKQCWVKD